MLRRCVGSADGRPRFPGGRSKSESVKLPADARHGSECGRSDWYGCCGRYDAGDVEIKSNHPDTGGYFLFYRSNLAKS